jgi:hypothetical protein
VVNTSGIYKYVSPIEVYPHTSEQGSDKSIRALKAVPPCPVFLSAHRVLRCEAVAVVVRKAWVQVLDCLNQFNFFVFMGVLWRAGRLERCIFLQLLNAGDPYVEKASSHLVTQISLTDEGNVRYRALVGSYKLEGPCLPRGKCRLESASAWRSCLIRNLLCRGSLLAGELMILGH